MWVVAGAVETEIWVGGLVALLEDSEAMAPACMQKDSIVGLEKVM